jgi:predicted transcriptional regulator
MAKSTTMTVWMPPNISEKVALMAHDTKRTKAYLGGEAIASYVERNAWQIARIKASLDDARSGSPGVPHGEVERWVKSWDTENELPRPKRRRGARIPAASPMASRSSTLPGWR